MNDGEQVFVGYVFTNDEDLLGIAVHRYSGGLDAPVFDVYYGQGQSDDELFTPDRFVKRFGLRLYQNLEDFKRGNSVDAYKVLV